VGDFGRTDCYRECSPVGPTTTGIGLTEDSAGLVPACPAAIAELVDGVPGPSHPATSRAQTGKTQIGKKVLIAF
jgi:hypothetical protein